MILVTGATGVTGHFVIAELLRRGHAVRALARGDASFPSGVEVARGDLADLASLALAARGASGIVHTACTYHDSAVDLAAMRALADDRPFVYLSSLDVYGFADDDPITEDTPLSDSFNDYASGKVACERLLRGPRHTSLRAPYIWGPHPTARRRLLRERLAAGRPIVLPGRDFRDVWVDARDLAVIIAECLAKPAGGPLNVLSGHFTWHDLYAELVRATGSRSEIIHKSVADITDDELSRKEIYARMWRFSEERLGRHLGPIPRRPFLETVRDTALLPGDVS